MINKVLQKRNILLLGSLLTVIVLCLLTNKISIKACEKEENQIITDDTIVTKDNIYNVLDLLQIDYDECEKINTNKKIETYTVEELRTAWNKINNKSNESIAEDTIDYTIKDVINDDENLTKKDKVVNMQLTRTSERDGYTLDFYVDVQYNKTKKKYVKTTGQGVDIDGNAPLLEFKIGTSSLNSSCTSKNVNLKGNVKVDVYIGVGGIGLLKIKQYKIKVDYNW